MQVILLEDVKALGKRGAVVKVTDGYARNFLFPKKLAAEATEGNVRALAHDKQVAQTRQSRELQHAKDIAAKLSANPVKLPVKSGDKGKLYGAVTSTDIAVALTQATGIDIDKKKLVLKEPIKRLGTYTVKVKLHHDVNAEIKIDVVSGAEEG